MDMYMVIKKKLITDIKKIITVCIPSPLFTTIPIMTFWIQLQNDSTSKWIVESL